MGRRERQVKTIKARVGLNSYQARASVISEDGLTHPSARKRTFCHNFLREFLRKTA